MADRRVEVLPGGRAVLVENGPLRLVIQAFSGAIIETELVKEAAEYAFVCLDRVAQSLPLLRQRHGLITSSPQEEIAGVMLESVRLVGDEDLTPMAAVAGTIADFVADWIFSRGASRVLVDNGGDIAVRLKAGEVTNVGFRPSVDSPEITHVVQLHAEFSSWGVNTSGMGGRSLTRGIASAVTVFAQNSSVADAAATAVANECYAEDRNIHQLPAVTVDPHTDLGNMPVTVSAAGISEETAERALENGLQKAEQLIDRDIIRGAVIVVADKVLLTTGFKELVGDIRPYRQALSS
ncbi:MAG: UPF0280 family protein [Deltaproteobacteria bacterium]|nr:UPF0280 family protein [Deltaproteobacteria bacterium]